MNQHMLHNMDYMYKWSNPFGLNIDINFLHVKLLIFNEIFVLNLALNRKHIEPAPFKWTSLLKRHLN